MEFYYFYLLLVRHFYGIKLSITIILEAVSSLQVKKESEEVALTENLFPMSETEASVVPNYKFSVKNVNDSKSRYEVVYKEQEVSGKTKII